MQSNNHEIISELKMLVSAETVLRGDEPLSKRTTIRIGGSADLYVEPGSESELSSILGLCARRRLKFVVIGRGSNLLILDGGFRGLVICLAAPAFSRIEIMGSRMYCGAGAKLKQVSTDARKAHLSGLEFLEGIPGTMGGALRMNAGAMGGWTFDVVESMRYMDYTGNIHEANVSEIKVEYRCCPLLKEGIALSAALKGNPASREVVDKRMNAFSEKRWESQPAMPSAGCIFKNPDVIPAGKLIDEMGLKGTRVGGAMVSMEHGNFIVNNGEATAKDVLDLIRLIREKASKERGIQLETEVEIIGDSLN
jgi:UDP-N-acetylenolpyruvoylglucosamine reductase